jgi:hypothetical protein
MKLDLNPLQREHEEIGMLELSGFSVPKGAALPEKTAFTPF